MSAKTARARWFAGGVAGAEHRRVLFEDAELGRVFAPAAAGRLLSLRGVPARRLFGPGELGVFVAKQHRPRRARPDEASGAAGVLRAMELLWVSVTHNERVDDGAAEQDALLFGASTKRFTVVAVANAALTKTKTDSSLGVDAAGQTTNEFTTLGLARAAGSLGAYTAPASLGGQFSRVISKVFTATGSATARGAGLFDSVTVAGSVLYVEDNFSADAVLLTNDTLTVNITITN